MPEPYAQRVFWSPADEAKVRSHFGSGLTRDFGMSLRSAALPEHHKAPADVTPRRFTFAISTGAVDRMGDSISPSGWKLAPYNANPVVLFAHASDLIPVGKAVRTWQAGGKLMSEVELAEGASGFARQVGDLLESGHLRAASVGFRPLKYAFVDDPARKYGIDFLEQELLEWSIVPVPANSDCLLVGSGSAKAAPSDVRARRLREIEALKLGARL